uniref:Uncharacterized protein n=1 Tax=Rangifer tarandus platyrhynchus TaxID=3082113 RepID=A0ACB0DZJ7_RANTA|nr:unnamed protein product [Rangifer tarandus platyrhynchus]
MRLCPGSRPACPRREGGISGHRRGFQLQARYLGNDARSRVLLSHVDKDIKFLVITRQTYLQSPGEWAERPEDGAPKVRLKPGPPAAAHPQQVPQTRSAPWHAGHCRAPGLPHEDGVRLPSRDMGAPRRPSLSRQDTRAQLLWEASRLPCPGDHVRTAVHQQAHPADALGVQGGSPEQGRLRGLDESHALVSTEGLNGVCLPAGAARARRPACLSCTGDLDVRQGSLSHVRKLTAPTWGSAPTAVFLGTEGLKGRHLQCCEFHPRVGSADPSRLGHNNCCGASKPGNRFDLMLEELLADGWQPRTHPVPTELH